MPVQFNCASCGKPIEIDDEFAGQAVTCPYCRSVVKAAPPGGGPPVAHPVAESSLADAPPRLESIVSAPPPPRPANRFASAGLGCGIVILLSFCVVLGAVVKEVQKQHPDGRINPSQMKEIMERSSTLPVMVVVQWTVPLAALAGTVLSILGLTRREGRRWQAIVGLTICGLFLTCVGLSVIMALTGRAMGK